MRNGFMINVVYIAKFEDKYCNGAAIPGFDNSVFLNLHLHLSLFELRRHTLVSLLYNDHTLYRNETTSFEVIPISLVSVYVEIMWYCMTCFFTSSQG
jgi:hypothetical protein